MKKLVISYKSPNEALDQFAGAMKQAKKQGKRMTPHYEIAFDNRKDFEQFLKNISILMYIINFKPKSVYELAKIMQVDQSNLNKTILFLESVGAVEIKTKKINGRNVKSPIVNYSKIEFNLKAA
ncbi:MAG: hypothetical protein OXB84_07120 [Halobacteriovoraceae bacterium]|nr:hypothetical protein [Halobacteriovoraceae bacterium]